MRRFAVAIVTCAVGWSTLGMAHHSTTYFSKALKDVVAIQGRITLFDFRSPHAYIYVETKEAGDQLVVWKFETVPAAWLVRQGWSKTSLSAGDEVTVEGFPVVGEKYAWLGKVTKQDGTKLLPPRASATPPDYMP
jgi:hypothetical protein